MPIDPILLGTLISSGLGFAGGLMGGDEPTQQQRRSFTESPATDPRLLLAGANKNTSAIMKALADKARKPGVQLRSRAVSSVGRPSSIDPATLTTPGLDIGQLFGESALATGRTPDAPGRPDEPPVRRRNPRRDDFF